MTHLAQNSNTQAPRIKTGTVRAEFEKLSKRTLLQERFKLTEYVPRFSSFWWKRLIGRIMPEGLMRTIMQEKPRHLIHIGCPDGYLGILLASRFQHMRVTCLVREPLKDPIINSIIRRLPNLSVICGDVHQLNSKLQDSNAPQCDLMILQDWQLLAQQGNQLNEAIETASVYLSRYGSLFFKYDTVPNWIKEKLGQPTILPEGVLHETGFSIESEHTFHRFFGIKAGGYLQSRKLIPVNPFEKEEERQQSKAPKAKESQNNAHDNEMLDFIFQDAAK